MTSKDMNSARFSRCAITPATFLNDDYRIWTLDFPFHSSLKILRDEIKQLAGLDELSIPYRVLNDGLMVVAPVLAHPFEWVSNIGRLALIVQTPDMPQSAEEFLPPTEAIWRIIRRWVTKYWLERAYLKGIDYEDLDQIRSPLLEAMTSQKANWNWKPHKPSDLVKNNSNLIYGAIPSLVAALLHGKTSQHQGKTIKWRKVQGRNGKLSIMGFDANGGPIHTTYEKVNKFGKLETGSGYFGYKVNLHMETQAGVDHPWLHIDLHAQRYSHEQFKKGNDNHISFLVGASKIRLQDMPYDNTLIALKADYKTREWMDNISQLLDAIGLQKSKQLQSPEKLFSAKNPTDYWQPDNAGNEYYLAHDTGYDYENKIELQPGYSMAETNELLHHLLDHLPMLRLDTLLIVDNDHFRRQTPKTWAMRTHQDAIKPRKKPAVDMQEVINRALSGEEMHISIVASSNDTRDGMCIALEQALKIHQDSPYPLPNVHIHPVQVMDLNLYRGFYEDKKTNWQKRVDAWRDFIQGNMDHYQNHFAIVELKLIDDSKEKTFSKTSYNNSRRSYIHGTIREAFALEHINTQMIRPIKVTDKETKKILSEKGDNKYRALAAAKEILLSHTGAFLGDVQDVFRKAGMQQDIELLAFYLRQTNSGVFFPVAIKVTQSGAIEACFPIDGDESKFQWMPYHKATIALGQFCSKQWRFMKFNGKKKIWELQNSSRETSAIKLQRSQVFSFVYNVIRKVSIPTIVTINAANWRNKGGTWKQLRNTDLPNNSDVLDFLTDGMYDRDHPLFENILAVVRLREGKEVAQYVTNTKREIGKSNMAGLIDNTAPEMMAYISIGKSLVTATEQDDKQLSEDTMLGNAGAGIGYKYPRAVELVPFYVHANYKSYEGLKQICRCVHYLRIKPAWNQASIIYPYPTHLGQAMMNDQLAVLNL